MKIGTSANTQSNTLLNEAKTNTDKTLSSIVAQRELSGKDNASLVISNALASQISTLGQNVQNANEVIGMSQIADVSLRALSAGTEKLEELSVRFNSDTLSSEQKSGLEKEFKKITEAMQKTIEGASYNGQSVLSSTFGLEASSLSSLSIDDQESITTFTQSLTSLSSTVSSTMNSAQSSIANALSAMTNLSSANANVSETPLDKKLTDLSQQNLKIDSSTLAQAHQNNVMQQRISSLLS